MPIQAVLRPIKLMIVFKKMLSIFVFLYVCRSGFRSACGSIYDPIL